MNFFKSLRFKLITFSVIIEFVMLSLLIANSLRLIENHLTSQATKQLQETKENFKASLLPLLIERDYASLNSILKEYTSSKKIVYIFILKDNHIIASSNWNINHPIPKVDLTFHTESSVYDTKVDIKYLEQNYGEVYFGIDTSFLQNAKNEIVTQSVFIALLEIILTIILLFSIGYLLTKNLLVLTNAAENIANNNFDVNLNINTKDEIGLLAKTFNKMVVQIKNQLSTIQKQNNMQKELIHSLDTEVNRVKTILENAGDAIHILDLHGDIFMFSDSFANSLGYSSEEIKHLNVKDWDKNFDPKEIDQFIENPKTFETIHTRKDGTTFSVEIRTTGVMLDKKMYLYAASRDITERQIAQKELREKDMLLYQQSKMASMGEMIGNIAHQWRQPLSLISTTVTGIIFKKEYGIKVEEEELTKLLCQVNVTAQFLSKTIDDFQNYLKPQKETQEFNVKDVVLKNIEMFGKAFSNNNIEIIMDCEDIIIKNSYNELLQVIINILNNAKDALKEKDTERYIFIKIYQNKENGIITIKDNAGGIPPPLLPKVFDAYFTTKHKSQGTGLGLYMSYQIIKNSFQGELIASNTDFTYKNHHYQGAKFTIIFPKINSLT